MTQPISVNKADAVIRPISNRVLVRPEKGKDRSEGGIVLPERSVERPRRGVVLAVGPGKYNAQGVLVSCKVQEGDVVLWTRYGGNPVEEKDDADVILSEDDIIAVIE